MAAPSPLPPWAIAPTLEQQLITLQHQQIAAMGEALAIRDRIIEILEQESSGHG